MKDQTIECPRCQHAFALEAAFASLLRAKIEAELRTGYDARFIQERKALVGELTRLAKAEAERVNADRVGKLEAIAAERETALKRALAKLEAAGEEAAIQVRSELSVQFLAMNGEIKRQQDTILSLRQQEVKMQAEKARLEEHQHEIETQNARALNTERARLREDHACRLEMERSRVRQELASVHAEAEQMREAQHTHQLETLRRQLDELRRKLESGGEQRRGEAYEVRLEEVLRASFPSDTIEAVPRGVNGADVRQRVCPPGAKPCAIILYETKHTANWNPQWTTKLRDDQRSEQADVAVLVTAALPKGVTTFALVDGVWVASFACLPGLAHALRLGLLQLASHRQAAVGRGEKMELVYAYLTGDVFRQHIESLVTTYAAMGEDLLKEKRALTIMWRRREKQLDRVTASISNLYGDLQTIAGTNTLPALAPLEFASLLEADEQASINGQHQQAKLM